MDISTVSFMILVVVESTLSTKDLKKIIVRTRLVFDDLEIVHMGVAESRVE